jgi:hypothetical protein
MTVVISRGPRADEEVKKLVKKLKKGFVIPTDGGDLQLACVGTAALGRPAEQSSVPGLLRQLQIPPVGRDDKFLLEGD